MFSESVLNTIEKVRTFVNMNDADLQHDIEDATRQGFRDGRALALLHPRKSAYEIESHCRHLVDEAIFPVEQAYALACLHGVTIASDKVIEPAHSSQFTFFRTLYREIARQRNLAMATLCRVMTIQTLREKAQYHLQRWRRIAELLSSPELEILEQFPEHLHSETVEFLDHVQALADQIVTLSSDLPSGSLVLERLRVLTKIGYDLSSQVLDDVAESRAYRKDQDCWSSIHDKISRLDTYLARFTLTEDVHPGLLSCLVELIIVEMALMQEVEDFYETLCLETSPAPQGLPGKAAVAA